MTSGEDGTYWIVAEDVDDEVGVLVGALGAGVVEEHGEVDVASQDGGERFGGFEFGEPDIEAGCCGGQPRQGGRSGRSSGGGECR